MNKEMIESLISDESDKKIIKKLTRWFTKNSSLIDEKYTLHRNSFGNIFHLLILKNKFKVIGALCENQHWRRKALEPDNSGNTVLHYAVRGKSSAVGQLIDLFPELLNVLNKYMNTPLHTAVLEENIDALTILLKHPEVDRSIKNQEGKTAFSLAKELALLFSTVNSSSLLISLNLKPRSTKETVDGSFRTHLPLMCPKSHSRSHLQRSLPKIEDFASDTNKTIEESVLMAKRLFEVTTRVQKEKESDSECKALQRDFNSLCVCASFMEHLQLSDEEQTLGAYEMISSSLKTLHPFVDEKYSRYQKETFNLQTSLIPLLLNNLQRVNLEPKGKLQVDFPEAADLELLGDLWLLTAGQSDFDQNREINLAIINETAIGLLSSFSLEKTITHLRVLYPSFDLNQKLIANFIIFQLLFYSGINDFHLDPIVKMQLKLFCKKNVNSNIGLGKLGKILNLRLQKMVELYFEIDEPIMRNFHSLNRLVKFTFANQLHSFDHLVDCAIALPREDRAEYVQSVASELRRLAMNFYQELSISEFNNCNWSKDSNKHLSPSIVKFTEYFNKLSFYFIEKILAQPSDNIKNAIQFLIEVTQVLCPLGEEKFPDLNHTQVLASVLSNNNISRLTKALERLSKTERGLIEEIGAIANNLKNYHTMREIGSTHRTALPFFGLFLRDVTFSHDGNENAQHRRAAEGAILKTILEIKIKINTECVIFMTDLPQFINNYSLSPEESLGNELYALSRRIQPKKTDHINFDEPLLDNLEENLVLFMDKLHNDFLKDDILPSSSFRKKSYSHGQLAEVVISFFENFFEEFQTQGNDSNIDTLIIKFQKIVEDIIRINNVYYFPRNLSSKQLNPLFYTEKIQELGKRMLVHSSQDQKKIPPTKATSNKRKSLESSSALTLNRRKSLDPSVTLTLSRRKTERSATLKEYSIFSSRKSESTKSSEKTEKKEGKRTPVESP